MCMVKDARERCSSYNFWNLSLSQIITMLWKDTQPLAAAQTSVYSSSPRLMRIMGKVATVRKLSISGIKDKSEMTWLPTTGLQDIRMIVKKSCLRLFGHVACHPLSVLVSVSGAVRLRAGVPPGFHTALSNGSSTHSLDTSHLLSDIGLSSADAWHLAMDLCVWRAVATAEMLSN